MAAPPAPFMFPGIESPVVPDPSLFFSSDLLSGPLPTNSYFQNYVMGNGDQPEYIHPYLVKSNSSFLSISFASQFLTTVLAYQLVFNPDLTISALNNNNGTVPPPGRHTVSSFTDLSLTLDLPSSNLRFFLVRGSPFLTGEVTGGGSGGTALSITTIHAILSLTSNTTDGTKHTLKLNNGQTWLIYTSSPITFTQAGSSITSGAYSGIIRIAVLPDSNPEYESIYDKYSPSYPVSGKSEFTEPFSLGYTWEKKGSGELLMLAHPLHLQLLSVADNVTVLNDFKLNSIDGELVGVVGDSWKLKIDPIPITWNSTNGVKTEALPEIVAALRKDVETLNQSGISTNSYYYGKQIARAARLAAIAEEVSLPEVIPAVATFLKNIITPWLDGTYSGNAFLYEGKWGGVVTKQGSIDAGADFGFGVYNDHHFHLGYFLYGIAVLAKIDPDWGTQYKPQAYSLMGDFFTTTNIGSVGGNNSTSAAYTRLRNFDTWKLHSWAGGLTVFGDGRNQESTSEAVNGYYAAALMGLAYADVPLADVASTITALEIKATKKWWHVKEEDTLYPPEFTRENRLVGILWSTKRDAGLWFAPPTAKAFRFGIQVLPVVPITEVLFSDVGFVRQAVSWTLPALGGEGVTDAWKGLLYAIEGIYDQEGALAKIRALGGHDDGNSLTNLLWWVHSRPALTNATST